MWDERCGMWEERCLLFVVDSWWKREDGDEKRKFVGDVGVVVFIRRCNIKGTHVLSITEVWNSSHEK
jgi:hypothetical protein